jgi:hypothetical protein
MKLALVLIEGQNVNVDTLSSLSLMNAKQLVVGDAYGFGVIMHIAAEAPADLSNALSEVAQVPDVTGVILLTVRTEDENK